MANNPLLPTFGIYLKVHMTDMVSEEVKNNLYLFHNTTTSQKSIDVSEIMSLTDFKPEVEDHIDVRIISVAQGGGWDWEVLRDLLWYRLKNRQMTRIVAAHMYPPLSRALWGVYHSQLDSVPTATAIRGRQSDDGELSIDSVNMVNPR